MNNIQQDKTMAFWVCDEQGNRIESLSVILRSLDKGGIRLAREHCDNGETLVEMLTLMLNNGGLKGVSEDTYRELSQCVVEHASFKGERGIHYDPWLINKKPD